MDDGQRTVDDGRWLMMIAAIVIVGLGVIAGLQLLAESAEQPVARSSEDLVWLRKEVVTVSTSGATSGSESTDRDVSGYVYAVHLDFAGSISATTDVTLSQASPSLTMLQLTNYYTDTWYYPVVQQHSSAGAAVSGAYERALVADQVDVAVGQTTSGTQILTATIYWGQ